MTDYDLAALDIAGTTVHEGGIVYRVLGEVVRGYGGRPTDADVRNWMGADKRQAVAALLALPLDDPTVTAAHQDFVATLGERYARTPPRPLPGVPAAFAALRAAGIRVALTTGFDRQLTDPLLAALGWSVPDVVDAVVCADEVAAGRPDPYLIQRAMALTGVTDPQRVLVAGDTVLDVRAGFAAGAGLVIGVLSGAQNADELAEADPDHLLAGVALLPDLLKVPHLTG